jgi:hypothetical protein
MRFDRPADQFRYLDVESDGADVPEPEPRDWAGPRDPTIRWGASAIMRFELGATSNLLTAEFVRMTLPSPRVCAITFHAEVIPEPVGTTAIVQTLDIVTSIGIGAAEITRRFRYFGLPTNTTPLDDIISDIPIHNLYAQATAFLTLGGGLTAAQVKVTAMITPYIPVRS